jgi:hypothetical protein
MKDKGGSKASKVVKLTTRRMELGQCRRRSEVDEDTERELLWQ